MVGKLRNSMNYSIIGIRLKPYGGTTTFKLGAVRIKNEITGFPDDIFDFNIHDGRSTIVKSFGKDTIDADLVTKIIPICNVTGSGRQRRVTRSPWSVKFNEDGTLEIIESVGVTNESLPRQQTVDQWKKLRKMTRGIDIGDRVSDMNKQGANIQYIQNPVDTGIESYEDFEKHNKKFVPSWNLKHLLSPFGHEKKNKK